MSAAESATFTTENGHAAIRLTPWDQRALGLRTAEFTHLEASQPSEAQQLIAEIERWSDEQGVQYLFGRINANSQLLKQALLDNHYIPVECSITLSRRGFDSLPSIPSGMRPTLRAATQDDLPGLQEIAFNDFHHGRFLEDPAIPAENARRRSFHWVSDLLQQGHLQVAESRGKVIGFHAERLNLEKRHAELILTGTGSAYAMLALPLWTAALSNLADRGIQSCSTLISAANTGVINLYSRLGFHFDQPLLGFRKFP